MQNEEQTNQNQATEIKPNEEVATETPPVKPPIKTLKVDVTGMEIACSVKGNSKHCMITDAIKRDYGKRFKSIVTDKEATAFTDRKTGLRYKFTLTPLARASLLQFDNGEHVEPFSFKLKNPIVRARRTHIKTGYSKPVFKGDGKFGATGVISASTSSKGSARRISRGIDRLFGSRVFKTELDALRNQLEGKTAQEVKA